MTTEAKYKVTLPGAKVVHLRQMTIKIKNQCIESAANALGKEASGPVFQNRLQDDMLKTLIFDVNGKVPSGAEREDLDNLFSMSEYAALSTALTEIMGIGEEKKSKIELVMQSA